VAYRIKERSEYTPQHKPENDTAIKSQAHRGTACLLLPLEIITGSVVRLTPKKNFVKSRYKIQHTFFFIVQLALMVVKYTLIPC